MSSTCFKRLNESCKTAPRFRPIQIECSFQNQRFGIQLFCATRPLLVFVCCRSCTEFNDIDRENHFCSRQQLGEWVLSLVAVLGARFLVPFPSLSTLKSLNCTAVSIWKMWHRTAKCTLNWSLPEGFQGKNLPEHDCRTVCRLHGAAQWREGSHTAGMQLLGKMECLEEGLYLHIWAFLDWFGCFLPLRVEVMWQLGFVCLLVK